MRIFVRTRSKKMRYEILRFRKLIFNNLRKLEFVTRYVFNQVRGLTITLITYIRVNVCSLDIRNFTRGITIVEELLLCVLLKEMSESS